MLLDEPTTGLSPKMVSVVLSKSAELRDKLGITVVLVEQNAKKALEIGDKAYVLVSGKKVYEGKSEELLNNPELSKMYFGLFWINPKRCSCKASMSKRFFRK